MDSISCIGCLRLGNMDGHKEVHALFSGNDWELKDNILASQPSVYRGERIKLVLQRSGIFRLKVPTVPERVSNSPTKYGEIVQTHTLSNFDPSTATRVRLPTISVGKTRSSRMRSCTLVKVRLRGRFCLTRDVRVGLRSIRRWATKTTCRSENFFSNSRVNLFRRSLLCEKRQEPREPPTSAGPCGKP
jgi:hypothetical protein